MMAPNSTSIYRGSRTRYAADSRPARRTFGSIHATAAARLAKFPAATALRMKITAAGLALVALLALAVSAPRTVTIPLATILLTGMAVAGVLRGVVALVDRQMHPVGTVPAAGIAPRPSPGWRA